MPSKRKQRSKLTMRSASKNKRRRLVPDIDISTIISSADPYNIAQSLRVDTKQTVTATTVVDKLDRRLREKSVQVDAGENTHSITGKPPTGQQQQRHGLREIVNWSSNIQSQDKPPLSKQKAPNTPYPCRTQKPTAPVAVISRSAITITPTRVLGSSRKMHLASSQRQVKLPSSITSPGTIPQKVMSSRKLSIAPSCNLDLVSMELTCQTVATNKELANSTTAIPQYQQQPQEEEEVVEEEMVVDDIAGSELEVDMEQQQEVMEEVLMDVEMDDKRHCTKDQLFTNSLLADFGPSPILMPSQGTRVQYSRGPLTSSPLVTAAEAAAARGKQATNSSIGSLEEHFGALNVTPIFPVTPLTNNTTTTPLSVTHTTIPPPPTPLPDCTGHSDKHPSKDCTMVESVSRAPDATGSSNPAVHSLPTNTRMASTKLTTALTAQSTNIRRAPCKSIITRRTTNRLTRTPSDKAECNDQQSPTLHTHASKNNQTKIMRRTRTRAVARKLNQSSITRHTQPAAKLPSNKLARPSNTSPANKITRKSLTANRKRLLANNTASNRSTNHTTSSPNPHSLTSTHSATCNSHDTLLQNTDTHSNSSTLTRSVQSGTNHSSDAATSFPLCVLVTMYDSALQQSRRQSHRHRNYSLEFSDDSVPMDCLLTL